MRRIPVVRAVVVGLGLAGAAGCGEERAPPKLSAASTAPSTAALAEVVPEKSDDAARAVVEKAIAAATNGTPSKLARVKVHRRTEESEMYGPGGEYDSTRELSAVWPDHYAVKKWTLRNRVDGTRREQFLGIVGNVFWFGQEPHGSIELDSIIQQAMRDDTQAEWMGLLVPLAEPSTVVTGPTTEAWDGRPADRVRVYARGFPPYSLWFDQKSSHLVRLTFVAKEAERRIEKEHQFSDPKTFDGLTVPVTVRVLHNNVIRMKANTTKIEFPEKIDPAVFERPAERN